MFIGGMVIKGDKFRLRLVLRSKVGDAGIAQVA